MYGARVGGVSPHSYGLQISVLVPNATETNDIKTGDALKLATTGAYHAEPCVAGDKIQLKALHPVKDGKTPLGCQLYGFDRVDKFVYTGTAPAIGESIEAAGKDTVRRTDDGTGVNVPNETFVLFVDTAKNIVEVAMP